MDPKYYFYYKMSIVVSALIVAVTMIVSGHIAYLPMLGVPFVIVMLFT